MGFQGGYGDVVERWVAPAIVRQIWCDRCGVPEIEKSHRSCCALVSVCGEIEAMFGLGELKKTRYYQDVAAEARNEGRNEGKLESVPNLAAIGLTPEQIAQALNLDLAVVKQVLAA
jgi:hypothetical protein